MTESFAGCYPVRNTVHIHRLRNGMGGMPLVVSTGLD